MKTPILSKISNSEVFIFEKSSESFREEEDVMLPTRKAHF